MVSLKSVIKFIKQLLKQQKSDHVPCITALYEYQEPRYIHLDGKWSTGDKNTMYFNGLPTVGTQPKELRCGDSSINNIGDVIDSRHYFFTIGDKNTGELNTGIFNTEDGLPPAHYTVPQNIEQEI